MGAPLHLGRGNFVIEVLWHGRGGQGAFTAARLLGAASSMASGRYALAFPSFGPERRGAPMRAFTKMDGFPIGDRSAIERADYVVYLDETLLSSGWAGELKAGASHARVLVNSSRMFDDERIIAIDADAISTGILGRPIPNTVFLSVLSVLVESLSADDVKEAIRQYMPAKLHAVNERIVDVSREELLGRMNAVSGRRSSSSEGIDLPAVACEGETSRPGVCQGGRARPGDGHDDIDGGLSAEDARLVCRALGRVRPIEGETVIPKLADDELDPLDFARSTCFPAGHLVTTNAGWRNVRPVVDEDACTGCMQCYRQCPDGTIFKVLPDISHRELADSLRGGNRPKVAIDYDFCKGCGICELACKFDAIRMVSESAALAVEREVSCR